MTLLKDSFVPNVHSDGGKPIPKETKEWQDELRKTRRKIERREKGEDDREDDNNHRKD